MRIHTKLTELQMHQARVDSGASIYFHRLEELGSRTHARSFEVRLGGTGGRNNTGLYGAGDYEGATWDEWGAFFGALYDADPAARCGGSVKNPGYADAEHYHWVTGGRFRKNDAGHYLPANTHKRHRWTHQGKSATGAYNVSECGKCGALQRSVAYGRTWEEIA